MEIPFSLAGRTAFIAGASSGLGARFARLYAKAGANVVLGARRTDRTEKLAAEIQADGSQALAVALDVSDQASVIAAFDAAEAAFGTMQIIVANAGMAMVGRSTDIPVDAIKTLLDTNVLGVYLVAREGAKRLMASGSKANQDGRIILIGSITADMAGGADAAYCASKAAVAHLARQFAREWIRQGINVNTIQPGYILTDINKDWYATAAGQNHMHSFHRQRLEEADALDDMMLYLASMRSKMVTGSTFTIDDGQSL